MRDAIALQSALDAANKRRTDYRCLSARPHPTEDAVREQNAVELTGHVCRKVDHAPALNVRPLAVRSRQHREHRGFVRGDGPKELGLFATHDVGRAGTIPGDEPWHNRKRDIAHRR